MYTIYNKSQYYNFRINILLVKRIDYILNYFMGDKLNHIILLSLN